MFLVRVHCTDFKPQGSGQRQLFFLTSKLFCWLVSAVVLFLLWKISNIPLLPSIVPISPSLFAGGSQTLSFHPRMLACLPNILKEQLSRRPPSTPSPSAPLCPAPPRHGACFKNHRGRHPETISQSHPQLPTLLNGDR